MSWKGTGQTKHSSCFGLLTTVTLGRLHFKRVHKPLAISHRRYNKPAADKEVDATFFPTVISNHRIYALRIRARSIAYRSNHFIWKNCCITIRQMFPSYSASGRQARGIRSLISAVNKHLGLCLLPISGNLSASQKKSVQTHEKTVGLSSADMASLVLEIVFHRILSSGSLYSDVLWHHWMPKNAQFLFIRPPFRRTGKDNNNRIESLPRQRDLVRSPTFYCQFSRRWTFLLSNLKDTIRDGVWTRVPATFIKERGE